MSTSGSYTFTLNKTQLITRALQAINAIDFNDTVESNEYAYASDMLNMLIKLWEVDGIHLFKRFQGVLFPQTAQKSYQLGSVSGADNVCLATNYQNTTINTAVTLGSSTIVLVSISGLNINQNIGIELDNNTRQWTTIQNINTGTKTVTLNTTTTSTAAVGNTVITYTNKINRPLEVLRATTLDLKNGNSENTLMDLSYDQYFDMPIKSTPGRPNQFYYDRIINNSVPFTGTLYLYPVPQNVYQIITFSYTDCLQDMLNSTDNIDLPTEWCLPIVTNLAFLLASLGYGKQVELQSLQTMADRTYAVLKKFDSDAESLKLSRNITRQR